MHVLDHWGMLTARYTDDSAIFQIIALNCVFSKTMTGVTQVSKVIIMTCVFLSAGVKRSKMFICQLCKRQEKYKTVRDEIKKIPM